MYSSIKKVLLLTLLVGCNKEVEVIQIKTLPVSLSSALFTSPFVAPKSSLLTMVWSKRIIGPVPDLFMNDTIIIYCKIDWDASNYTLAHPLETTKMDSLKIIFKKI